MRKALGVAVLLPVALVAGCAGVGGSDGGGGDNGGNGGSGSSSWSGTLSGALPTMGFGGGGEVGTSRVAGFKAAAPDVKVTINKGDFDAQQFLTAVSSGNPPDLGYMMSTPVVQGIPPVGGGGEHGPASTRAPAEVAPLEGDGPAGRDRDRVRSWVWRGLYLAVLFIATMAFVYPLVGVGVPEAQVAGVRQPARSRDGAVVELRRSVGCRAGAALAVQLRDRRPDGRHRGHALERPDRLRVRLLPVSLPQPALRAGARHDDAARRGDDDPRLPDLEPGGDDRHPGAAVGPEPVRLGLLHLLAAAVLPRHPARAVRGRAGRRGVVPEDVPRHRSAAGPPGARHRVRVRAAGQLVGPDETADLPADPRLLHDAAWPEVDRRRVRAVR